MSSVFARAQTPPDQSAAGKEFIMSCTYGVLAGTLVGAATLAFSDNPGNSLSKVARGASIGLYAGILLGLYVVYWVPDQEEELNLYEQPGYPSSLRYKMPKTPRFAVLPTLSEKGIDGASAHYQVFSF